MDGISSGTYVVWDSQFVWIKEESHAARWGLLRGYSGKATKWVDFVKAGSTQRKREEPCPKKTLRKVAGGVKGNGCEKSVMVFPGSVLAGTVHGLGRMPGKSAFQNSPRWTPNKSSGGESSNPILIGDATGMDRFGACRLRSKGRAG